MCVRARARAAQLGARLWLAAAELRWRARASPTATCHRKWMPAPAPDNGARASRCPARPFEYMHTVWRPPERARGCRRRRPPRWRAASALLCQDARAQPPDKHNAPAPPSTRARSPNDNDDDPRLIITLMMIIIIIVIAITHWRPLVVACHLLAPEVDPMRAGTAKLVAPVGARAPRRTDHCVCVCV